ncbi:TRAP transporter small permease [Lactonifactor longoviformis]|uniref:TRAP transporter small permease n=1 Tax=Lactonifactor longoviformis TaxID=341220 RepID=UPI0036F44AB4
MMKKLDRYLDTFETGAFSLLLSIMTIVVFIQVICRYILHASLPWSEEVSRYCMIYTVFIGVGAGLKAGTHTGVDALVMILPQKAKWIVILIEKIMCFILSGIFFGLSAEVVIQLFESGQKSATLFIPIAFAYLAMPVGFLGGMVRSAQNIGIHIKEKKGEKR